MVLAESTQPSIGDGNQIQRPINHVLKKLFTFDNQQNSTVERRNPDAIASGNRKKFKIRIFGRKLGCFKNNFLNILKNGLG